MGGIDVCDRAVDGAVGGSVAGTVVGCTVGFGTITDVRPTTWGVES